MAYYDDLDCAHALLMKKYEEYRTAERVAVIYDQQENRRRVLVIDLTLYSRERLSVRHS
jgi:hypothetical protein